MILGRSYPNCGYGNGTVMLVSTCGFAASSLNEAIAMSKAVTEVTLNHPEGINSMIQAAKRKGHGFHAFEGLASTIYLMAAKFQLAVPDPFKI